MDIRGIDEKTGFYYLNSRYYSPELHRFISVDNFNNLIGLNLYCYCSNNPINNVLISNYIIPTFMVYLIYGTKYVLRYYMFVKKNGPMPHSLPTKSDSK